MGLEQLLRLLTTLSCVLLLSACSTVSGWFSYDDDEAGAPAELVDIVPEVRVKRLWTTGVGNGQGDGYYRLRPVIDGERIYAASNNGHVVAVDREDGDRIWKIDLDDHLSGGVGVGAGMVLLGTSDGEVLALSDADGSELWRGQVTGEVLAAPQTDGDVVVVQSYDGKLYGLSAQDGSELWAYDSNVPVLTLRGTSTPIIFERFAIAAFGNGRVVALDVDTGAVRWEARVSIAQGRSEIDRIVDIDGTMLQVGTVLWAASYQGRLVALEISSGRKLRQEDVSSYVGLDQGFGNIYVAEETGTVIAYLRSSTGIRWEQGALTNRRLSAPRVIKGYLAVADFEGYVHFLSQVDGRFVGREKIDGDGIRADMLADDNVLYVYGNSGKLVALRVTARDSK
jgi:outer membrane protein assembly factor BamB